MTAAVFGQTNNNQPPGVLLRVAHGALAACERTRAMGNGRQQPGGVSIYDAREARSR